MATRLRKLDSGLRDPSVLVPTNLFGPDVIVRYSNSLLLMGHIKSCLKGNTKELDATTTVDAINCKVVHKSCMSVGFIVTFTHILW